MENEKPALAPTIAPLSNQADWRACLAWDIWAVANDTSDLHSAASPDFVTATGAN